MQKSSEECLNKPLSSDSEEDAYKVTEEEIKRITVNMTQEIMRKSF